jgi:hypothetical protein
MARRHHFLRFADLVEVWTVLFPAIASNGARVRMPVFTAASVMRKRFGQLDPHWLDDVIETTWRDYDPRSIAFF